MDMDVSIADVRKRTQVSELAPHDIDQATQLARSIKHPWYRCQALAFAADAHSNRKTALRLLEEAFRAADEQDEINRIVTVASWPLRVLARLAPERAEAKLGELLEVASRELHTLRRADALSAVAHAVAQVPELKEKAVPPLVDALLSGHGWRIERLIRDAAILVRADYPHYFAKLLAAHPENRRKRKLMETLGGA